MTLGLLRIFASGPGPAAEPLGSVLALKVTVPEIAEGT
jgi:hypothetical protein